MQDHDVVAIIQGDGLYIIQEWRDQRFVAVSTHAGRYDEAEATRRLMLLGAHGDGWISDGRGGFRRIDR